MSSENMSVSLDDFIKFALKKWKPVVALMLLCGILTTISFVLSDGKIEIAPSEKYLELKAEEASFMEYEEASILIQMDSANVYETTLYLEHISDMVALEDYVTTGSFWTEESRIPAPKYLAELLTFEKDEEKDTAKLHVWHSEKEKSAKLAHYVEEQIELYDSEIEIRVGKEHVIMEPSVADVQEWLANRLQDIRGQLEYAQAGCVITVHPVAALVLGAVLGMLLSVVFVFAYFVVYNRKQNNETNEEPVHNIFGRKRKGN